MAHHVQDHAAAIFGAIVPARALDGLQVAFEHPVAELQAYRQHLAEEAGAAQHVELAQAGQEKLVLHGAVLEPRLLGQAGDLHRLVEVGGDGLLAVDVLAGADGLGQQRGAHLRGAGIEEDGVVLVLQCFVKVGAPALNVPGLGQGFHLFGVAADQYRVGHHLVAI